MHAIAESKNWIAVVSDKLAAVVARRKAHVKHTLGDRRSRTAIPELVSIVFQRNERRENVRIIERTFGTQANNRSRRIAFPRLFTLEPPSQFVRRRGDGKRAECTDQTE